VDRVDRGIVAGYPRSHSAFLGSVGELCRVEIIKVVCGEGVARGGGSVTKKTNGEDDEAN